MLLDGFNRPLNSESEYNSLTLKLYSDEFLLNGFAALEKSNILKNIKRAVYQQLHNIKWEVSPTAAKHQTKGLISIFRTTMYPYS